MAVDPTGKFLYLTNFNISNLTGYTINAATGALTAISGSPFPTATVPGGLAVDPTGKFLYVTNGGVSSVSGYTINATTGALTNISGSPFAAGSAPSSVAFATGCTAPVITDTSATPDVLWPPNGKFVDVSIAYTDTSNCPATCKLSVTSNEPADGGGDSIIVNATHVELRAERHRKGAGRIYTITITCTNDTNQKSSSNDVAVFVPHDQGQ